MSVPDYPLGTTVIHKFTTRSQTQVKTAMVSPVISVYESGNVTVFTTGVSLVESYNSRTGLNEMTAVCSSGNGYESGKFYTAILTTGTLDGISMINEVVHEWSIGVSAGLTRTELADGGRIDNLIDAIPTTAMRGTDSAYTGTPPTVGAIADAVWDEVAISHVAAGSFGKALSDVLVDSNELQTDWTNDGRLDALLDAVYTGTPPTAAAIADAVFDEAASGHVAAGSFGKLLADVETATVTTIPGLISVVIVMPLTVDIPQRNQGQLITTFTDEVLAIAVAVTNSAGVAVDLTGIAMRFDVEDKQKVNKMTVAATGTSTGFNFTTTAQTVQASDWVWAVRRSSNQEVLGHGVYEVIDRPKVP